MVKTKDVTDRIPVDGETLWTTKVEPSHTGSGSLPPNPTFHEEMSQEPSPELEALLKSFSMPTGFLDVDEEAKW